MNTKSNNIILNTEFNDLFSFDTEKDKHEYNAQMISYRILSEVERVCEERKLKKKDLAQKIGTSKSYITQLFRGSKSINTQVMAKFEDVLDISFEIKAVFNEYKSEFISNDFDVDILPCLSAKDNYNQHYLWHSDNEEGNELLKNLETEKTETSKQAA